MYLRETKRRNRDGSTVSYLQLAHSERHPVTGVPSAKVIHNFGRAEAVDRDALARLVASISRFLDPQQAIAAAHAGEIEVLDSRRFGGAWVLDQLWERLGIGAALHRLAADRRLDADATERVLFALVAQRALEPGSKLAATGWVGERVAIAGCAGFSDDAAYRAMDFLLDALGEIAAAIFDSVAHLLNLDVDIVFVDTTSTYWEVDGADELADLQPEPEVDDGACKPVEYGARRFGKSKDHRDDLPQVVIAMAVTRDGIPVRCWTFPGSESDQRIIRTVKDDLGVVEPAPAGVGRRRRVRLGRQPRLPHPRWRALHPRREAAPHQRRGRRRAGPPRPLPRRRRQPAGQGSAGRTRRRRSATGRARNGSWCATTPTPPSATKPCANGSSSTWQG